MPRLVPLLLLLLCLCPAFAPGRALAAPVAGFEQDLAQARALTAAAQHEAACDAYLDMLRAYPDNDVVNLELARAASLAKRYPQAYMAYDRLVANNPQHAGLRLEYAGLLTQMGNVEAARIELEAARRLDPTSISERDIKKTIDGMERKDATFAIHGRVAAGVLYDSNMNSAPTMSGVRLGGIPIELDDQSTAKDTWGTYIQGVLDVSWRADPSSPWWLVGDAAGYQRWNFRQDYRRDLTFGRAALGLRYLDDTFMLDVRGKVETALENNSTAVNISGGEATALYAFTPKIHGMARGGLEYRHDYQYNGRSGMYWWAGPYGRFYFGEGNHSLMPGLKVYGIDANDANYSHLGFEPSLTLFVNLPWSTELIANVAWHQEQYNGPATIFEGIDRRDNQFRASAFLIHNLTDNWRIELGWQYTNNKSNSELHTYDQHMVMTGVAWTF